MTKEALSKLNDKQTAYCEALSSLIDRARMNGLKAEFEVNRGKLRGFLECLCQMEVITGIELRALFMWFFEKNRKA